MALFDFFKPKWKSKDPEVRLAAVRAMGAGELTALRDLAAGDEDVRVRLAAVERIGDRATLEELLAATLPPEAIRAARAKLDPLLFQCVLGGSDSTDVETDLERIVDPALLERLAAEAPSRALRVKAVERIGDAQALCRILEKNCGKEPARAALAKIDDESLLARLGRSGANKLTRRLAEEKRAALVAEREEPTRRALREREIEGIVRAVETLGSSEDRQAADRRLASLRLDWNQVDPDRAHPRWPDFVAAAERYEALRQEERRRARAGAEAHRVAEEILEAVEALAGVLDDDAESRFREAEVSWAALPPGSIPPQIAERYEGACRSYREARSAAEEEGRRLQELAGELDRAEAQLEAGDLDGAAGLLASVDRRVEEGGFRSVDPSELRARLSAARKSCEERRASRAEAETLARREGLCAELEGLAEAEDQAAAGRRARQVQRAWRDLPGLSGDGNRVLEERFRAAAKRFAARQEAFNQEQEWLRWNNRTLKEGLCAEAEALDAEEDLELLARKVKELHRRWKDVGAVPRADPHVLWERFKTACDRSYERARPHFEELERRRAEAVERKEELCRQAEARADSTDWKESAEVLKSLQAQWKEAGPLPRKGEQELYARFRRACNRFFERRKSHIAELAEQRRGNQGEKERLCERAEALAAEPERGHTRAFRELQAEWKRVGPAPRDAEQALWERFRSACDRYFEWLGGERLENLRRKEALCGELEALLVAAPGEGERREAAGAVAELRRRWREIGPVPTDRAEALWDRFQASCDAFSKTDAPSPS